jgi:putative NADH-flavin reductase
MQITVLGGTGRTGKHVVEQALSTGHSIKVLARSPEKLTIQNPNLTVFKGALHDEAAIAQAVAGSDAVISALGPSSNKPVYEISQAMERVVAAMKKEGVKRIVITAGAGVRAPGDEPGLMDKGIVALLKLLNGNVLKDMSKAVEDLQQSGLEWTVLRGPMLTDDPATGIIRQGGVGKDVGTKITRADFAAALLAAVNDPTLIGKMPAVSN